MLSMVASSIAKAADDVGDAGAADDRCGASLEHARLPAVAAVAIRPRQNIGLFHALKAVTSVTLGLVLGRGTVVTCCGAGVRAVHKVVISTRRRDCEVSSQAPRDRARRLRAHLG